MAIDHLSPFSKLAPALGLLKSTAGEPAPVRRIGDDLNSVAMAGLVLVH